MNTSNNRYRQKMQSVGWSIVLLANLILLVAPIVTEASGANVLFILDGSGSMWGRLDNVEKIVIAKETMSELVQGLPVEQFNIGLMVYGHRRKGDCDDIEMLTPLGQGNPASIVKQIQSINPKGKTPITGSITLAAEHLKTLEEESTIVLVSDGEETCEGDPCAYVKMLKESGIKFVMHVVGFDVNEEQKAQLACIAEAGGGQYFSAQSAVQMQEAFMEVKTEVIKKAEMAATPAPEATPEVEPGLKLRAVLKEGTEPLNEVSVWRVYEAEQDAEGKRKQITSNRAVAPLFTLPAGHYVIKAEYGRAEAFTEVEVVAGELTEVTMNLNAGSLRLQAIAVEGAEPLTEPSVWRVYEATQDVNGKRKQVTSNRAVAQVFTLPAGHYVIKAEYGYAEAFTEVEVMAGELTEVTMNLNAGSLRLQAIAVKGAEPLTEPSVWRVYEATQDVNGKRKQITSNRSVVQVFTLPAGHYVIKVEHGDTEVFMDVEVTAGELTDMTVDLSTSGK